MLQQAGKFTFLLHSKADRTGVSTYLTTANDSNQLLLKIGDRSAEVLILPSPDSIKAENATCF